MSHGYFLPIEIGPELHSRSDLHARCEMVATTVLSWSTTLPPLSSVSLEHVHPARNSKFWLPCPTD